jgi:hypothetical protein
MRRARIVTLFLAATLFLLQGGDCLSLFFSSQQARDCCHKGQCSPKNPDPCCQVSSKTTVTQHQAKEKERTITLTPQLLVAWTVLTDLGHVDGPQIGDSVFSPSPPGETGNFSLPLLV